MAVDQALLEGVAAGHVPVLRFYRWRPACLSFGRNQRARGVYDGERARALGIDVVRRQTGGLAVLHDAELTYAVALPAVAFGGPRATYAAINRALALGLRTLGVAADLAGGARRDQARAAFEQAHPCFEAPAAGEVVVGGRKLVGSAQRVERRTILQHGSILLDGSQSVVQQLEVVPSTASVAATTVRAELGAVPGVDALVGALADAFSHVFGISLAPATLAPDEAQRVTMLEPRFAGADWTWRR